MTVALLIICLISQDDWNIGRLAGYFVSQEGCSLKLAWDFLQHGDLKVVRPMVLAFKKTEALQALP